MAKNVKINGVTYQDVPSVKIPLADNSGNDATFYDTSDATANGANILDGYSAYNASGKINGFLPVNEQLQAEITTPQQTVTLNLGYYPGGTVKINPTEAAKIVAGNIKAGVSILGVAGSLSSPTISQDNTTKILSIS